jgi:hypothetical protein
MTIIKIKKPSSNAALPLYHRYPSQSSPQPAYIELNCKSGQLAGNYNAEIGNAVPLTVYHGHERRWELDESISSESLSDLLSRITPLAQRILDGYESVWDGRNKVAVLDADAQAAENEIIEILAGYAERDGTARR